MLHYEHHFPVKLNRCSRSRRRLEIAGKGPKSDGGRPTYISAAGVEALKKEAMNQARLGKAFTISTFNKALHAKAVEEAEARGQNGGAIKVPSVTTAFTYRQLVVPEVNAAAKAITEKRITVT